MHTVRPARYTCAAMPYRFIVVDDEEISRKGLATLVDWHSLGFEVVATFEDGREAISFLDAQKVDVVLSDIKMIDVDGIGIARHVAEHHPQTHVVLISAYRDFEYARQAIECRVDHYLLKPFRLAEVTEVFQRIRSDLDSRGEDATGRGTGEWGSGDRGPVDKAIAYMRDHLSEPVSLDSVARHACLSPVYLSRLFRQKTGETYSSHLARLRVERASQLLRDRRIKVYEVCERVGYTDVRHFYKTFRRFLGVTPTEYRKDLDG